MEEKSPQHAILHRATTITNASLLRGTDIYNVMWKMGAILRNRAGNEETYALSEQVGCGGIDEFISHNWSTPRWLKFFALCLHYNTSTAMVCAWFVGFIVMNLTVAGWLPFLNSFGQPWSINAFVAGEITFIFVFLFKHDVLHVIERLGNCMSFRLKYGRVVFLDKVCIHQTDQRLQQEGIQSLAGFLRQSNRMLVIYSNIYLRKLWTVYELASFLTIHKENKGSSRIRLMPVLWPQVFAVIFLGELLFNTMFIIVYHWAVQNNDPSSATYVQMFLVCLNIGVAVPVYSCAIRRWQRRFHDIQQEIRDFSLCKATCAVESDRALVQNNVCAFMRCLGLVPEDASETKALHAFERMVQEELPFSLMQSFGGSTFPYHIVVAAGMGQILNALDEVAQSVCSMKKVQAMIADIIFLTSGAIFTIPLFVVVTSKLMRCMLHLHGWREVVLVCVILVFGVYPILILYTPFLWCRTKARSEDDEEAWIGVYGIIGYTLFFGLLTAAAFSLERVDARRSVRRFERRASAPLDLPEGFAEPPLPPLMEERTCRVSV